MYIQEWDCWVIRWFKFLLSQALESDGSVFESWLCCVIAVASVSLTLFIFYFIYLFLTVSGLRCRAPAFSGCSEWGLFFIAVCGLLIAVAFLVAEHGL